MLTAPSFIPVHPNQMHLPMPVPPPTRSKSHVLDILKLLTGLLIALMLGAILAVLIFAPNTANGVGLRESYEKIARLERESNENIARLQREKQMAIEYERQKQQSILMEQQRLMEVQRFERQENLTANRRLQDQLIEREYREQDINRTMEQSRQQLEIEQKRLELLLEERQLAEQHRKEDLSRKNADLVSDFMEEFIFVQQPLDKSIVAMKVQSLLRQLDPLQKSVFIDDLYRAKLLTIQSVNNTPLELHGANLKDLNLDGIDGESGQVGSTQTYVRLALPSTNLINASFNNLFLDGADFSSSDMMGASFRSSRIFQANFSFALLSLSNFQNAEVMQSIFSYAKIQRASFRYSYLTEVQMNNADFGSSDFQSVMAFGVNFSQSELSNTDFRYAELSSSRMDEISARSANFYSATARQANFTKAYMPDCIFQWANLQNASFKYAVLPNANFENADVQGVDFSRALLAGANLTAGQLDVVLSITNATLPDGSIGKNKNLVKNGNAQCGDSNGTIFAWMTDGNVFLNGDSDCAFQAGAVNATLQQSVDLGRFQQLVENGQGKVYIAMRDMTTAILNPSVYMIVRFFDSQNIEIAGEGSSLGMVSYTPTPQFSATLPCPSNTVQLQITMVFRQVNATVDDIYVTIE